MRKSMALTAGAAMALAGCATIISGGDDDINVRVNGAPTAECSIRTNAGVQVASVTAPGAVEVPRGEQPLTVICEAEGYGRSQAELFPELSDLIWLNGFSLSTGYLVDWLSDNYKTYPEVAIVYMERDRNARLPRTTSAGGDRGDVFASGDRSPDSAAFDTGDAAIYLGFSTTKSQADSTAEFMWLAESDLLADARPVVQQRVDRTSGAPQFHIYGAGVPRFDAEAICQGLEERGYLCRVVDTQG